MSQDEPAIPASNAIECVDCSTFYRGTDECPEDPSGHGYLPVFITAEPLGRSDDQDNFHHGLGKYVYTLDL